MKYMLVKKNKENCISASHDSSEGNHHPRVGSNVNGRTQGIARKQRVEYYSKRLHKCMNKFMHRNETWLLANLSYMKTELTTANLTIANG